MGIIQEYFLPCWETHGNDIEAVISCMSDLAGLEDVEFSDDQIIQAINDLSADLAQVSIELNDQAFQAIEQLVSDVNTDTNRILDNANTSLIGSLGNLNQFIDNSYSQLLGSSQASVRQVTAITSDAVRDLNRLSNKAIDGVSETSDTASQIITNVGDQLEASIVQTFREIDLNINHVADESVKDIGDFTNASARVIENVSREVSQDIQNRVGVLTNTLTDTSQTLMSSNKSLLDAIESSVGTEQQRQDIFAKLLNEKVIPPLGDIAGFIRDVVGGETPKELESALSKNNNLWLSLIKTLSTAVTSPEDLERVLIEHKKTLGFWGEFLLSMTYFMSSAGFIGNMVGLANTSRSETFRQNILAGDPVNIFSFVETLSILNRGFISEPFARQEAAKSGFDDHHFITARRANETPIDIERSTEALHREKINEDDFKTYLKRQGFNEKDINILNSITDIRPGVQDLITMAVREVFSSDIADIFGLNNELPDEFVEEAKKNGLNAEWSERYWMAHWRLPSANQGYEMFHRGIINQDTLELLLRTLDIMPFWRDKLVQMAYTNITRVDIRRLHSLGLLSEVETTNRYERLGYDPNDALLMTEYTKKLSGDVEETEEIDIRELNMSQIKKMFLLGTNNRQQSIERIENNGWDNTTAEMIIDSWIIEENLTQRTDLINRMIRRAIRESLSVSEVSTLFSGITLTNEERERIANIIEIEQRELDNVPSKTELRDMVKEKIISLNAWHEFMARHGYNSEIRSYYIQLYEIPNG